MIIVTQPTYGKNLQKQVFELIRSQNSVLVVIGTQRHEIPKLSKENNKNTYFKNIKRNMVVKLNADNFKCWLKITKLEGLVFQGIDRAGWLRFTSQLHFSSTPDLFDRYSNY